MKEEYTITKKQIDKIICFFKGHQWIEWEHSGDRPRTDFVNGTAILINVECARCGIIRK